MSKDEPEDIIEDLGTALDKEKKRVQCNYCGKEVNGFARLKHHLGAVGTDVVACEAVPADVKALIKNIIIEKRKERLLKEVGEIYHPDLPLKRNFTSVNPHVQSSQPQITVKEKKSMSKEPKNCANVPPGNSLKRSLPGGSNEHNHSQSKMAQISNNGKKPLCPKSEAMNGNFQVYSSKEEIKKPKTEAMGGHSHFCFSANDVKKPVKEGMKEESALHASRCIAEFLFEAGLDLTIVNYPSFQRMIDAAIGCKPGYKAPRLHELGGQFLNDKLKHAQERVEEIKHSWGRTGCSILLDGWIDASGRNLISFLADCPQGTIFLKSVDASSAIENVDALFSLLSNVVKEVGAQNVVQVVSYSTSCYMEAAGKKLMEKHLNLFWTLSVSYCINLILEKIGVMDNVKKVLAESKSITKFIYSHDLPLELMREHLHGKDLVRTSKLKFVTPFVILENMVSEKESLARMFCSPRWNSSIWASRAKGKAIADLVKDPSFWAAADEVLKATLPLIAVLRHTNGDDKTMMGGIYEAMDRAKESIRLGLGNDEARFMPLWCCIDEIWDNYIHSPLHSAGYYLNPGLFYSSDFFVDAEVANGLLSCIVRLVEDRQKQDLIVLQLDAYRAGTGGFAEEAAVDQKTKIPPELWWSLYGGGTPELQSFAIRVLSQSCRGASEYMFGRSLSEKLHMKGRNCLEQERLRGIEFVNYNLRLSQSLTFGKDPNDNIVLEDLDLMDDSVVE